MGLMQIIGGSKKGDQGWYEKNIPIAEKLYQEYLEETDGGKNLHE